MHNTLPYIREKKEVLTAYRRFQPQLKPTFEQWSKQEFVYTSSLLEGGTLSKAEITQVIDKGVTVGGKTLAEHNTAVLEAQAVNWIRNSASLSRYDVNEQLLISLHHLPTFLEKESSFLKYSYQVPYVLTEFTEWLHQQRGSEVEVAVAAHMKLLEMKPFKDSNPKTARLLMNLLLLMDGYPLSVIREEDVAEYKAAVAADFSPGSEEKVADILYQAIFHSLEVCLEFIENKEERALGQLLKIGQLAKLTGETIPTIRHWTKQGLLQVAAHSEGGYQLYDPAMAGVAVKIRELQREKRMKVSEIREVVG